MVMPAIVFIKNRQPHAMVVDSVEDRITVVTGDARALGCQVNEFEGGIFHGLIGVGLCDGIHVLPVVADSRMSDLPTTACRRTNGVFRRG